MSKCYYGKNICNSGILETLFYNKIVLFNSVNQKPHKFSRIFFKT